MPHGYPLHIDATCDKGNGGTFLCLAGWNFWVLHAERVGSENTREMPPAVERTLAAFGHPSVVIRDLGPAGARAIAGCQQRAIPHLLCHLSFLAAVGHKLLDGYYSMLSSQISCSKVRSQSQDLLHRARSARRVRADLPAILLWILEGEGHKHLPFSFALPHLDFFRRCEQFPRQRDRRLPRLRTSAELGLLRQASQALAHPRRLNSKAGVAARLDHNWTQFRALRSVLHLCAEELPRGARPARSLPQEPEQAFTRLQAIASDLRSYRKNLHQRVQAAAA